MSRIFFVADPHVGADKFGLTGPEWNEPLVEVMSEAEDGDVVIVAGDLFHRRNPSVQEYTEIVNILRNAQTRNITVHLLVGNHDLIRPGTPDATSLLAPYANVVGHVNLDTVFEIKEIKGLQIGMLHWPMLELFETDETAPLNVQLADAARQLVELIKKRVVEAGIDRLDVFTGHAHFINGTGEDVGPDPKLIAGRDLLIPIEDIYELSKTILCGHIHQRREMYIGSTQPTDLGDTTSKSYVRWSEPVVSDEGVFRVIEYKTALRLIVVDIFPDEDFARAVKEKLEIERVDPKQRKVGIHLVITERTTDTNHLDTAEVRKVLSEMGFKFIQITNVPSESGTRISGEQREHLEQATEREEVMTGSAYYLNQRPDLSAEDREKALAAIDDILPDEV